LIPDQYVRITGYIRKYAIRVLSTPPAKITPAVIDGKTVTGICSGRRWLYDRLNKLRICTPEALKSPGASNLQTAHGIFSDGAG
jgi:hypothetical protein